MYYQDENGNCPWCGATGEDGEVHRPGCFAWISDDYLATIQPRAEAAKSYAAKRAWYGMPRWEEWEASYYRLLRLCEYIRWTLNQPMGGNYR